MYMAPMRSVLIGVLSATGIAACRGQRTSLPAAALVAAPHSVFTDSALHVEICEPLKSGEDWRRVCVPKDQSAIIRLRPMSRERR